MPYSDGMAAINLEMPDRVPRTEFSADFHWKLVHAVTGIGVDEYSAPELQDAARKAFMKAWNYDFCWCTFGDDMFGGKASYMGHGEYMAGGTDFIKEKFTLYDDPDKALGFDPWELYGEKNIAAITKSFNGSYRRQCEFYPDAVNMTGIYPTCISGLIDIFGWDMLLTAAGTDRKAFGEVTNRYVCWMLQYFTALAASDAPVVMVHDDIVWTAGAFLHPDWYRQYVFPNYKKLFRPLIDSGKKIMFTSDGCFTEFIDDIIGCGVHGLVMEPMTDMAAIAERYGKTHVFIGNADTRVLLCGSREDIENEVKRCMDIGKGCPGYFMAVGNHIPPNTPVDNALWYNECYERMSKR